MANYLQNERNKTLFVDHNHVARPAIEIATGTQSICMMLYS